jgi:hypothetical protein
MRNRFVPLTVTGPGIRLRTGRRQGGDTIELTPAKITPSEEDML